MIYDDGSAEVIKDDEISPGYKVEKEFKVKNNGDEDANFGIILDKMVNDYERKEDWTYILKKVSGTETVISTGQIGQTSEKAQYIYLNDLVEKGKTNNYKLEINYEYLEEIDQSDDMNKELSFRVNIGEAKTIFDLAEPGTLLKKLEESVKGNEGNATIPGREPSRLNEAYIGKTEDNYGTSYYYRGNVKNNYVNFANMCWRIVRIQGNGSIKIVLADKDNLCSSESYRATANGQAFIATKQSYNSDSSNKEDAKYSLSEAKTTIEKWLQDTSALVEKKEYMDSSAIWCMDLSEVVESDATYFGTYKRLNPLTEAHPSLKCNFAETGSKVEKYLSGAGLLSADEVAFAGSTYSSSSSNFSYNYYLKDNTNDLWETLSPAVYGGWMSHVFYVSATGDLAYNRVDISTLAVRPVLVLKANTPLSEGAGTQQQPFTIN